MRDFVVNKLWEFNIPESVIYYYDEPHRFYHNFQHIETMITSALNRGMLSDELFLAIVFHDIVYNPKANNNEELSAELFYGYVQNDTIKQAILDTKTHKPTNDISKKLCGLDLEVLYSDYQTFIDFEHKIFKEYQWVDYKVYKEKRLEILSDLGVNPEWLNYVRYRKPSIGVYAGSFSPFHKGHYSILKKAEQIFDKVIIARGINPEKRSEMLDLPEILQFRQAEKYYGLLTDFINGLGYDVTLIRGLRNATDLQYELTQYRFLQDLKPDVKVVSIFCDKEYEHISSSAIRQLKAFGKQENYLI